MKKFNLVDHFSEYNSLLQESMNKKYVYICWQKSPIGERLIRHLVLTKIDTSKNHLEFIPKTENLLTFKNLEPIYGFCEESNFLFKTTVYSNLESKIILVSPAELSYLNPDDPTMKELFLIKGKGEGNFSDILKVKGNKDTSSEPDFMKVKGSNVDQNQSDILRVRSTQPHDEENDALPSLSIEEEEKAFSALRESQRIKPKEDKYVTILRENADKDKQIYKLLDLSQGGAGLHCLLSTEFVKGEKITIIEIDGKAIDKPLVGEVVAIRSANDEGTEYKIGIKFS